MLVVTSNWCVSDGTLSAPPPRRVVDRFRAEVRRSSLRCGFRRDGRYRPVESIDVVLAGDTFDWLVSRDCTTDIRPWHGGGRAAAARDRVAAAAVNRGRRLLATLAGWMRRGIPVPDADRRGRPASSSRSVPVRVAVLPGDRDRWLERAAAGLKMPIPVPAVGRCWSDGDVTVQHGEAIDPLHAPGGRQPTLGESLAVDLVAAFGAAVHDDARLRPLAADLLRVLAGGGPEDVAARLGGWLAARERLATLAGDARQNLIDIWHLTVDRWHRAARRLPPQRGDGVDMVDRVAGWLELRDQPVDRRTWHEPGWFSAAAAGIESDAAMTFVLGHPPVDGWKTGVNQRRVVGLGPPARQAPDGVAAGRLGPAAVVVHPGRQGRFVEWLPLGDAAGWSGEDGGLHDATPAVWWSDTPWWKRGIVDAA